MNKFIYKSFKNLYSDNKIKLTFHYIFFEGKKENNFFHKLSLEKKDYKEIENLENIIFHIGLIEAINYWKIAVPKEFIIECGYLDKRQIEWFKKLYYNGLGEFIFINKIKTVLDDFINFKINSKHKYQNIKYKTEENPIILIGGGKDSIVTYNLLKNKFSFSLFSINPIKASQDILKENSNKSIILSRILDPELFKFNKAGYLNGHIPFSSIVAFISIWIGLIYKFKYIVLSNEASANEENIIFNGLKVNHQYSKSLEFENDFRNYISEYITKDVEYFSFLRPLDEVYIGKLFSNFKSYFPIFRSCNVGSKKNEWCGNCSKCLFTYIILCNFIKDEDIYKIFNKNLLDDKNLYKIFIKLTQKEDIKPFDCVGTYDEINYAIQKKIDTYIKKKEKLPFLLENYNLKKENYNFKIDYINYHNLPPKFLKILKDNVTKLT